MYETITFCLGCQFSHYFENQRWSKNLKSTRVMGGQYTKIVMGYLGGETIGTAIKISAQISWESGPSRTIACFHKI